MFTCESEENVLESNERKEKKGKKNIEAVKATDLPLVSPSHFTIGRKFYVTANYEHELKQGIKSAIYEKQLTKTTLRSSII
jgi:hypothetical protein